MAKLYISTLVSINGTTYTVEIWDDSASATVKTLLMTGEGFIISRQGEGDKIYENPIRGSRAAVTLSITNSTDIAFFQNMGVTNEGKYHMVIKKGSSLHWVGRILADQNEWERTPDGVFTFTVTSVDTLELLSNYELDVSWFDADSYILISDLIYRILNSTGMTAYWNSAGATNSFFADALDIYETISKISTSERISRQKISANSFYKEFSTYSKYGIRDTAYGGMLVNCKEALERVLIQFNARIILENGMFWIYNPLSFSNYNTIRYNRYNTSGVASQLGLSYNHAVSISTANTVRPKWREFPKITHQIANKEIKTVFNKNASTTFVRSYNDRATTVMTVGKFETNTFEPIKSEGKIMFLIDNAALNPLLTNVRLKVKARTYSYDGSSYKVYRHSDKTWVPSAGKPNWTENEFDLPRYYTVGFPRTVFPYEYSYEYQTGADNIYTEFEAVKILYQPGYFPSEYSIYFYGAQRIYQRSDLATERIFTNTTNTGASKRDEYELFYYDGFGRSSHGNILVWNGSGYQDAQVWTAFPTATHTYESDIVSVNGYNNMAVYNKAVQLIEGDWYDADNYHVMKSLFFDSGVWVWQGGQFYAQSSVYKGEWLKIGIDFGNVVVGSDGDIQQGGKDNQYDQALVALSEEVSVLYDTVLNLTGVYQYNLFYLSGVLDVTPPTINSFYNVQIKHDVTSEELFWNVQELGKVQSLNGGTHSLDPKAELIVCNSTAEDVIINLPAANTTKGIKFYIKKTVSSNKVRLQGSTIDGITAYEFNGKDDCKVIMSDGTGYYLVAYYHK